MKAFHSKFIRGSGGIKCDCCRLTSVKGTRVALNRITRRAAKKNLKKEVDK